MEGGGQLSKKAAQAASKAAATFAPRASGNTGKNPAVKGSVLYQVFEVQVRVCVSSRSMRCQLTLLPTLQIVNVNYSSLTPGLSLSCAGISCCVCWGLISIQRHLAVRRAVHRASDGHVVPLVRPLFSRNECWVCFNSPPLEPSASLAPSESHPPLTVRILSTSVSSPFPQPHCPAPPPPYSMSNMPLGAAEGTVALGAWVGYSATRTRS